jgi:hypothetical protein
MIFLAIYEYLGKKRYILLGLIFACILLTRFTAALGIIFILLEIVGNKTAGKVRNLLRLVTPIAVSVVILFIYNYLRFGNIIEQGYKFQILGEAAMASRNYGIFSFLHIPGNLYYFLFASFEPVFKDNISQVLRFPYFSYNEWGISVFITSTYLIKLFFVNYRDKINRNLLIASIVIALPIFMYNGIGFRQFGYRYSLDFLPYLFLLIMLYYRKTGLTLKIKIAMFLSIFLNLYLLFSKTAFI